MLVTMQGIEPVTTTLAIASGLGVQHKNVLELVRKYEADLRAFGEVAFETRPGYHNAPVEAAILNEPQATLLISFARNTDVVREFKKRLVKAFYEARDAIRHLADQGKRRAFTVAGMTVAEPRNFVESLRIPAAVAARAGAATATLVSRCRCCRHRCGR